MSFFAKKVVFLKFSPIEADTTVDFSSTLIYKCQCLDHYGNTMKSTKVDNLVRELSKKGILKTQEILKLGISKEYLRKLKEKGVVERIARGIYTLPGHAFSATQSIAEVYKQAPRGVICLLSALRLHGFTTQNPFEVWIAVERTAWKPKINSATQVKYLKFSGKAFTAGVQTKTADHVKVKVYCPAKTVGTALNIAIRLGLMSPWRRCGKAGEKSVLRWMNSGVMQRYVASVMLCVLIWKVWFRND
jgi:hypothetical protein